MRRWARPPLPVSLAPSLGRSPSPPRAVGGGRLGCVAPRASPGPAARRVAFAPAKLVGPPRRRSLRSREVTPVERPGEC